MESLNNAIPRYPAPASEVLKYLQLSKERANATETRKVRCPYCHYLVAIIPTNQTDLVFVKCQKCKFTGPLDPAYFRRLRRSNTFGKKYVRKMSR